MLYPLCCSSVAPFGATDLFPINAPEPEVPPSGEPDECVAARGVRAWNVAVSERAMEALCKRVDDPEWRVHSNFAGNVAILRTGPATRKPISQR